MVLVGFRDKWLVLAALSRNLMVPEAVKISFSLAVFVFLGIRQPNGRVLCAAG